MAGRTTSARAAALRKARDVRAEREAKRARAEARIDAALADFFEASAQAEKIEGDAVEKAAQLMRAAEKEAGAVKRSAAAAIRVLRDLDQTNAQISEMTGLSVGAVRMMAAELSPAPGPTGDPDLDPAGQHQRESIARANDAQSDATGEPGTVLPVAEVA